MAEKYAHISFKPPSGAKSAGCRALQLKKDGNGWGTPVGWARARDLCNGTNLSPETVRRMKAYFDRHIGDKKGANWGDDKNHGYGAWLGWGGDSGYAWARKVVRQMDAADEKSRQK